MLGKIAFSCVPIGYNHVLCLLAIPYSQLAGTIDKILFDHLTNL